MFDIIDARCNHEVHHLKIVSLYLQKSLLKFVHYNKFWKFYHFTFLLQIVVCGMRYESLQDQAVNHRKNSAQKKDRNAHTILVTKPVSRRSQVFWDFDNVNEDSGIVTVGNFLTSWSTVSSPKNTLHTSSTFQEKYCPFDLRNFNGKTQNNHPYMHLTFFQSLIHK